MAIPDLLNSETTPVGVSLGVFGVLLGVTVMAGIALTNLKVSAADSSTSDSVTIQVKSSCTMSGGDSTYNANVNPGQETSDLGPSNIQVVCNDAGGFAIYAIGFSGDKYTGENHTKLIGTTSTIPTGTSGDNSWWAFKVNPVTGTYQPSIAGSYSSYSVVPDTFAKVAYREASTDAGAGATGSGLQAYYKVKASLSQTPEDYTGRVKYTLVHPNSAPAPSLAYMQDLTLAQCQAQATDAPLTVYDRRDGSDYTVRYINGNCWMTQNLRITGIISATDSNFSGADFNTAAGGDSRGGSMTYTAAQSHRADSTDATASSSLGYTIDQLGAWYNYCAASAGQVCSQTKMDATQDICPANWNLPTYSQENDIKSYASLFLPIYGGQYANGILGNVTMFGFWWASTASDTEMQYTLGYNSGNLSVYYGNKRAGNYIRCVRST